MVEEVAIPAFAFAQFALAFAKQIRGTLDLLSQCRDLIRPARQGLQFQPVHQAPGVLLYGLQAAHDPAGDHQVNAECSQRAQDAAENDGAEKTLPRTIAFVPRLAESLLLLDVQKSDAGLKISHRGLLPVSSSRRA